LLRIVLFLQVLIISILLAAGYFVYLELGAISSAIQDALSVIEDIREILPKLDSAINTINELDSAFESLSGISEVLNMLLDPFQSNS
jgi:hypothetical protein